MNILIDEIKKIEANLEPYKNAKNADERIVYSQMLKSFIEALQRMKAERQMVVDDCDKLIAEYQKKLDEFSVYLTS